MEGILALMIPVLAIATGLVAVLKMPREAFLPKDRRPAGPPHEALAAEVQALRLELDDMRERLDFTERLLSGGGASAGLAPAPPPVGAAHPSAPA